MGETLTADASGIADVDGVTNATFAYQWLADDTALANAVGSTYILASGDQGKTIKVRVSFTDDAGNSESLTSAATAAVKQPVTASVSNAPGSHDGQSVFTFDLRFSEEFGVGYRTLRDHAFTVKGGDVVKARRLNPPSSMGWEITVEPDGNAEVSVSLPATTDCASEGAICTEDGRMLSGAVELTVPRQGTQQQSNTPATGAPTISGTAQVGETLTADTSGIADADGLTSAAFAYQWIAGESDISGATVSGYTLTSSEQGKTIKVRVTFTDDAGNEESLTSAAMAAVAAANSPATGAPTISGTAQAGGTLTADTSGISDTDGLTGTAFGYQWLADDATIGGVTASTYTVLSGDVGKAIKVRVTFTDDAGNEESLTSAATTTVAAANSPATGAPTISGAAQVGETLTADASGIADEDGTANAAFTHQWIAGTADIAGATGSSYTLTSGEQAQAIKVRVTFDDDAGNREILTSAATAPVRALTPFTAEFRNVPDNHDGATAFTFELYFNKVAVTSWRTVANDILEVSGGEVTGARRLDPDGADRSKRWEVTVEPTRAGDVTITLPVRDCAGANAVCANEQPLARAVSATVAHQEQQSQAALTARTSHVPASHDGNSSFTFELRFSEEFGLSYKTLRDHAFAVTGGEVIKARRLNPPSSVGWEITVRPDGDGTVTIVLPITTDCAADGAICTEDGRKLSNRLEMTVSGP